MTLVPQHIILQSPASNDPLLDLNTQPSLDLQFATGKTLDDRVSGNNLVTFSRASTGTYVGSDGLIKTSPVNLLTYSNLITSANWTFSRLSAPTSATTEIDSPVSGSSVFKLLETTDTGEHYFRKTSAVPIASSTTVTTSLYINTSLGRSKVRVYSFALNNLTFIWDLVNNAEISLTGGTSATVESTPIGNNWYRLKWTDIATANNDFKPSIMSVTDSNQFSFAGDTSKGFYITGYQIEEGSTATTYIPTTTSASGAPRFDHDPVTGESLGLLIEESRTNLAKYSEPDDRSTSSVSGEWNSSDLDPNTEITKVEGPDGVSNSASEMQLKTGSGIDTFLYRVPVTSGASYTFSAWVKLGTATNFTLHVNDTLAWDSVPDGRYSFDVNDGLNTNTFVKVSHTFTAPSNGIVNVHIGRHGGTAPVQQTQGTVTVWGCQLELGAFSSSTIITSGSTVTRAADVASITGTNFSSWFNPSEGTIYSKAIGSPQTTTTTNTGSGYPYIYSIDSSLSNRLIGSRSAGVNNGSWAAYAQPPASFSYVTSSNFNTQQVSHKVGGSYTSSTYVAFADGAVGSSITPGTNNSALLRLSIGSGIDGGFWGGHIARLAYYPYRLADATLQEITS
jgi:hypothetical protein